MLKIEAFGGLTFYQNDTPIRMTARVDEALLIYLAAHHKPIPRSTLIDLLWQKSDPQQANNNFRSALSRLRRTLGDYLVVTRQAVAFDHAQPYRIDAVQFEQALADGTPDLHALPEVITLYQGDFLAGFEVRGSSAEFQSWVVFMQERLRILAVRALDRLTRHALHGGSIASGLQHASQLVRIDPLNEEAHRLKMWLHLRNRDRSAALQQYALCRQQLADELATEPLRSTTALFEQLQSATPSANNLPPAPSPFIGRALQRAHTIAQLHAEGTRLVTLTGMGGIGKTRLALTVADYFVGRLLHGVYFVSLVGATDPSGLAQALAASLGVVLDETDSAENHIVAHLHSRECLILFDNYEPLLIHPDATALIERLLHDAPAVRFLVTSRESLQLYEETVMLLDGLKDNAPALFAQHAARLRGQPLATQPVVTTQIERICQLVDGVPLAIELAAGSTRSQDLTTIADGIASSFDALQTTMRNMPSRQRSLRAVFDYSWQLLTVAQRHALARLGLFASNFDQQAAEAVAVPAAHLHMLSAKSLVETLPENRFALHPIVREFANARLLEPMRAVAMQQFCDYFATAFVRWSNALSRGLTQDALAAWAHDHPNVVRAWWLAVDQRDSAVLLKLLMPIGAFHNWRNWYVSAENLYANAASELDDWRSGDDRQAQVLGDIILRHAYFVFTQGRYDEAVTLMYDALPLIKRGGSVRSRNLWHRDLVQIHLKSGNRAAVAPLIDDLLVNSDPTRDPEGHANRLYNSQHFFKDIGDYARATAMLTEAQEIFEELGDTRRQLMCQYALANTARAAGDYAGAVPIFRDCLAARLALGDTKSVANTQSSLADALYYQGDLKEAKQLAEAARGQYAAINDPIGWPYALNVLGNIARDGGEKLQALTLYQEALQMALDTKRTVKVAELLLDWLLLMEDELEQDFFLGGLTMIAGLDSTEYETRRIAQHHLNNRHATPISLHELLTRAQSTELAA